MAPSLSMQQEMWSPNTSFLSILFSFLFSTSWRGSTYTHQQFLHCLSSHSQDFPSISSVIYTPNNSSYLSIWQSAVQNLRILSTATQSPLVIITPFHESQIQPILYCSKAHGLQIRVRSGGHDYEGLSFLSESPFLIVDMRNLRSISIDAESKTAWVGGGATLGELYYNIAKKSRTLAFPAGTCPTVGVGGHISGGGYSMMSRKHGLAADHVIDARLMNVNGSILDRESMGEDLFWAIRGGGGASFGVILAWKIELVSVPENVTVFNVTRTLDQSAINLIHQWQYIADKIDENLLMRLFMTSMKSSDKRKGKSIQVSFTSMFIGGVDTLLPIMEQSFPELGLSKEDCIEMSWIKSIIYMADFPIESSLDSLLNRVRPVKVYYKGKSDYVKEPISKNGLEGIWKKLQEDDFHGAEVQFTAYGGKMSEISEFELPFPHRSGNIYMIHYGVYWFREGDEEFQINLGWLSRLYKYMANYVSNSPRSAYLNYRDLDLGVNNNGYAKASIWGNKYFKNNFNRLVHIKTMVDPENFFRNEQSIQPISSWWKKIG